MEEQISMNIDNLWELKRLQRKALSDEDEKTRLRRALVCRRQLMDLEEACEAEHFLELAHRCTSAMDDLADVTSPETRRTMLSNTFMTRTLDTKTRGQLHRHGAQGTFQQP